MRRLILLILFSTVLTLALSYFCQESGAATPDGQDKKILSFAELPEFNILPGKIIYDRYCAFCHGSEGKGDGLNAFSLQKRPADLQKVLVNRSDQEVEDVILLGGLAVNKSAQMPSFARTISARGLRQLQKYLREKIQNKIQ
jgi:mono/diheme cytochrome c family protein